jgi:serine phosphatase RsbU (regulator of sigma subunit)
MNRPLRIAVADDEQDMRDYYRTILPRLGHTVISSARDGRELVEQCRGSHPDLVITDIKMPELDGIEAAAAIHQDRPTPVILVSAYHDLELIKRAESDHIVGYLVKPIKQADLQPAIVLAMRRAELVEKNAALEQRDRQMQFHLDVAGRIQRQLLPAGPPEVPSFAFALAYHPLDQVSGDYYDFAMLPSGRLGILIADAAGHSVPAAFVSVMAKTAFHAYAQGIESPAAVLSTMNQRLASLMEADQFITMFYGVVDRQTLQMVYALAGHPRPLWYRRAKSEVEVLDAEGPVIGVLREPAFEERSVQLAAGDLVLIYTDGVTECRNEQDEQFGQHRLEAFLAAHGGAADAGAVSLLDAELARFRGAQPVHDDVTCIGLSVKG